MLVEETQLPARVFAKNALLLDRLFEDFFVERGWRIQDDFTGLAYDQYAMDGSWRAVPLLMDLSLLRFNRTTLENMEEKLPPPHGGRDSWTWGDFVGLVCNISSTHGKGSGLRAMSGLDDDFKLAMLMAQSRGGCLLRNGACGLRNSGFEESVELFKKLVLDGCMGPGRSSGLTYWRGVSPASAALDATVAENFDPIQPPSQTTFSECGGPATEGEADEDRTGPGFFFATGMPQAPDVGRCPARGQIRRDGPRDTCERLGAIVAGSTLPACREQLRALGGNTLRLRRGECEMLSCSRHAVERLADGSWEVHSTFCSEILYADMPGRYTVLGGSGLMIPKAASDACHGCLVGALQEFDRIYEGWRIILELVDSAKPWALQMNSMRAARSLPPLVSLSGQPPFTEEVWEPSVRAARRSVPSQYPASPSLASGRIQSAKPLRIALLRAVYGNISADQAVEDGCAVLEELVRPCDRARWQTDPNCISPVDGLPGCPVNEFFASGCQACDLGRYQPERNMNDSCLECPCGWIRDDHFDNFCKRCPGNKTDSAFPRDSEWDRLSEAPVDETGFVLVRIVTGLMLAPVVFVLHRIVVRRIPISNVHIEFGCLIVETAVPHRVLRRPWWPLARAWIDDASHPMLDGRSFRVAFKSPFSLQLLDESGAPIASRADTSKGELRISLPFSFFASGWLHMPAAVHLIFSVVLFLVIPRFVSFIVYLESASDVSLVPACPLWYIYVASIAAVTWTALWFQRRVRLRTTPLQRRLRGFGKSIRSQNPRPRCCHRGPGRAVSMGDIWNLFETFQYFVADRDMYYVASNIVSPLSRSSQLSYAELVGPKQASWCRRPRRGPLCGIESSYPEVVLPQVLDVGSRQSSCGIFESPKLLKSWTSAACGPNVSESERHFSDASQFGRSRARSAAAGRLPPQTALEARLRGTRLAACVLGALCVSQIWPTSPWLSRRGRRAVSFGQLSGTSSFSIGSGICRATEMT